MVYRIADLAAYFAGEWRLEREILTADGVGAGEVAGTATFTETDEALVYEEAGELRLGGYRGPVSRTLHYRQAGPGQAAVHFDHGGFFHDVDLRTGAWSAEHPCRADVYRGEYRVLDAGSWRQEWAVRGPAKDHLIVTRFRRA